MQNCKKIENQDKFIHLLGNRTNGEDSDLDIIFNNIEVWDDGDESITLFMSIITELDENNEPIDIYGSSYCSYPVTELDKNNKPIDSYDEFQLL